MAFDGDGEKTFPDSSGKAECFGFVFVDTHFLVVLPLLKRWQMISDARGAVLDAPPQTDKGVGIHCSCDE